MNQPPDDSQGPDTKGNQHTTTAVETQATQDPCKKFPWHKYQDAEKYLMTRFEELLVEPDSKHKSEIKSHAIEHLVATFDFSKHANHGNMRRVRINNHTCSYKTNYWYVKITGTWFKNKLQRARSTARQGTDTANAAAANLITPAVILPPPSQPHTISHATSRLSSPSRTLDDKLAPLLSSAKGRARGPSNLWAAEHKELVRERKHELQKSGGIPGPGAHQKAVKQLFEGLSEAEQKIWQERAKEERLKAIQDVSKCYMYVCRKMGYKD